MSPEQSNVPPGGQGRPESSAIGAGGGGGGDRPSGRAATSATSATTTSATRPAAQATARGAGGGARFARFAIDYLVPFAVGLVLTLAVYLLLVRNLPTTGTWGGIRAALAERGFIPYCLTMLLFWQLSHLGVRFFVRLLPEFAAMNENLIPPRAMLCWPDIITAVLGEDKGNCGLQKCLP